MIPRANITAWRASAPWPTDAQIEQDLILSRALTEIFQHSELKELLAFRGGTALHKFHFDPPGRYSEDIDLVQTKPAPIGPIFDALRDVLEPWLGSPIRKKGPASATQIYRFETTALPAQRMRLKIEINTREHFSVIGYVLRPFSVVNPWFNDHARVLTFDLHELLATKLRALYQRKKGRDLYDLYRALELPGINPDRIVECFLEYMRREGSSVSRAQFESNLFSKIRNRSFGADIIPLLATPAKYDSMEAAQWIRQKLISILPGDSWQGWDEA